MNHGFIDGNKRVAFACVDVFLGHNGAQLEADPDHVIAFIYSHLEIRHVPQGRCWKNGCEGM